MGRIAKRKEKDMATQQTKPTTKTAPTTIDLTYNEPSTTGTRNPPDAFTVDELLVFRSSDASQDVKVVLHPKSAYEPNIYDQSNPNPQPVRVVKAEKGAVWCYLRKKAGAHTGPHTPEAPWSE